MNGKLYEQSFQILVCYGVNEVSEPFSTSPDHASSHLSLAKACKCSMDHTASILLDTELCSCAG